MKTCFPPKSKYAKSLVSLLYLTYNNHVPSSAWVKQNTAGDSMIKANQHAEIVSYMSCSATSKITLKLIFFLLSFLVGTNIVLQGK